MRAFCLLILGFVPSAHAITACSESHDLEPLAAAYCRADLIFVGELQSSTVQQEHVLTPGGRTTTVERMTMVVRAVKLYKGTPPPTLTFIAEPRLAEGGVVFRPGKQYLVFARYDAASGKSSAFVTECGLQGTDPLLQIAPRIIERIEAWSAGTEILDCAHIPQDPAWEHPPPSPAPPRLPDER